MDMLRCMTMVARLCDVICCHGTSPYVGIEIDKFSENAFLKSVTLHCSHSIAVNRVKHRTSAVGTLSVAPQCGP